MALLFILIVCCVEIFVNTQCSPTSEAMLCSISPVSAPFANVPKMVYQSRKGLEIQNSESYEMAQEKLNKILHINSFK